MPFRFACQHCGQLFSVSADRIGLRLKCPNCQAPLVVPGEEEAARQMVAHQPRRRDPTDPPPPPMPEKVEIVGNIVPEPSETAPRQPSVVDPSKVAVPRTVIYVQGILLGLVGLAALILGILVSRTWLPAGDATSATEKVPCTVQGQVTYANRDGRTVPDASCAVLAVPTSILPDEKLDTVGLRPDDPALGAEHPTLQALHVLGGDYGCTDDRGFFRLTLPQTGSYFLLFLSGSVQDDGRNFPDRKDLAELGRYVTSAFDLLGNDAYGWCQRRIKSDVRLDWEFDRATD